MKLSSLEEAKSEMKKRTNETEYYFAIVLKHTGKVIGEIDAYPEHAEPHDKDGDLPLDTFSLCWMLNKDYNLSCQHLCEKLGMRREGLFKEFVSFVNNPDGTPRYENTIQYAILKKRMVLTDSNLSDKFDTQPDEFFPHCDDYNPAHVHPCFQQNETGTAELITTDFI